MAAPLSNWQILLRLLHLAVRYRWGCLRLIGTQVVLLGLSLVLITLTGVALDCIAQAAGSGESPQWPLGISPPADWSPLHSVAVLGAAVLAVALLRAALSYFYTVDSARLLQQQIVVELRARVYEKLQRLSFRFYSGNTTGTLINRVTGDVQAVRLFIDGVLLQLMILVLALVFYLAYMVTIHVGLTLLCLATTPLLWTLAAAFCRAVRPAYYRNRELVDEMLLVLTENVRGAHVVRSFGRQEEEIEKFREANHAVRDQQKWIFWRISLFGPAVEMLLALNLLALLGYGGYLVIEHRLALGTGLITFSGLLQQFSGQVTKMTNIINSIQQSLAGAQRVFELLEMEIEVRSPSRPHRARNVRGTVEFDLVGFDYRQGQAVLRNLSLSARPGQCIGILGPTGAGKTTLLHLIPRFYDACLGAVRVDGVDVRRWHLDDLRRQIGIVFQENFLFSDTVAANIAFGRPDASFAQIRRAAQIAAADQFISALPQGYDTVLREAGKDLSGGQRQRLAIARAILREPPILLLDDPTAAVDARTEQEILRDLAEVTAGRTTFLVAHRLSTLQSADIVVVLEEGRVVEIGSPENLLVRRGTFWQVAQMQAEG